MSYRDLGDGQIGMELVTDVLGRVFAATSELGGMLNAPASAVDGARS